MLNITHFQVARAAIAAACTAALDEWQQDADGVDEWVGTGGFCGRIADVISEKLSELGAETVRFGHDYDGGHESVIALFEEGPHEVDVPARVYESGWGYVWRKRPDARIEASDIVTLKLDEPMAELAFHERYGEGSWEPDDGMGPGM